MGVPYVRSLAWGGGAGRDRDGAQAGAGRGVLGARWRQVSLPQLQVCLWPFAVRQVLARAWHGGLSAGLPKMARDEQCRSFPGRSPNDSLRRSLSGLHEPIGEAIGLALDRGIEHLDRVRIVLVREQGAFRVQHKAGRLHLLANRCRVDPMQRLGVARARPNGGGVINYDIGPARLQPLIDRSIEARPPSRPWPGSARCGDRGKTGAATGHRLVA